MSALFKLASRGSVVAALAFLTLAPACGEDDGDDDASDAGSSGKGGSAGSAGSSGGKAGSAGSAGRAGGGTGGSTGGRAGAAGTAGTSTDAGAAGTPDSAGGAGGSGATDAGGTGGDDGTAGDPGAGGGGAGVPGGEGGTGGVGDDDPAVAKFCNTLTFGDETTTMILEIGEGSEKVTFTADTDECVPADGEACTPIPVGADVRIQLFDSEDPSTALDDAPLDIDPGVAYVFNSNVDGGQPIWEFGPVADFAACSDFTFEDL